MKVFCDSTGAHSAGGRLFHMVGPLTAKLRCPTADAIRGRGLEFPAYMSSQSC